MKIPITALKVEDVYYLKGTKIVIKEIHLETGVVSYLMEGRLHTTIWNSLEVTV